MDVLYLILIGVGVLSMAVALFMKVKPALDSDSKLPTPRPTDKAETERLLQQLGRQIRQDKDGVNTRLNQLQGELLAEVNDLRQRIEQLESGMQLAKPIRQPQEVSVESFAAQDEDVLVLRERYRRAFELHREGLSFDEIAKRLGAGRGEIDLIFALAANNERGMADA